MYRSTPSRGTPRSRQVKDEGPIAEFIAIIENTPLEEWQKRSAALRKFVDSIPEVPARLGSNARNSGGGDEVEWWNAPMVLRSIAPPIGELIKDPRSTVVKRTCESLARLFHKSQVNARYLFRDLMPTVLSVHAQTVQVIRNAVQYMVMESIPYVPCKMVMPLWMERMKVDKSRTVRDACALYLGHCLRNWTEEGYLTEEIWLQVGNTLIRTLRDPSPQVRTHAKDALEQMQETQPVYWNKLLSDPEGPAARDKKVLKWLQSIGNSTGEPDPEELSVASKFSYNSDTRFSRNPPSRSTTPKRTFTPREEEDLFGISQSTAGTSVPTTISYEPGMSQSAQSTPDSKQTRPSSNPRAGGAAARPSSTSRAGRETSTPMRGGQARATTAPRPRPNLSITVPAAQQAAAPKPIPSNGAPPPPPAILQPSNGADRYQQQVEMMQSEPKETKPAKSQNKVYADQNQALIPPSPPPLPASLNSFDGAASLPTPERVEERFSSFQPANLPISPAESSFVPSPQHKQQQYRDIQRSTQMPPSPAHSAQSAHSAPPTPKDYLHTIHDDHGDEDDDVSANGSSYPDELESNPSFPTDLNHAFGKASAPQSQSTSPEQKKNGVTFNFQEAEEKILAIKNSKSKSLADEAVDEETDELTDLVKMAYPTENDHSPSLSYSASGDLERKEEGDGPFIQSMQQLKQHASKRRSRNSIMMQERFRMSGSFVDGEKNNNGDIHPDLDNKQSEEENEDPHVEEVVHQKTISSPNHATTLNSLQSPTTQSYELQQSLPTKSPIGAPEHMIIAIRLLRAHKAHVDQIMETLKIEMDTLRDFDRLLEEPGRPTEDEVLDYFEGVGLCLDQRTQAGDALQREMDRISRGEPPQD